MTNTPKSITSDQLTITVDENRIELTEQELSRVTGGEGTKQGKLSATCCAGKHYSEAIIS